MAERRQTALGVARSRFIEGLPRKAREVKASLALLAGTPEEDRPREELRRRLHALYASSQVFRIETLASALRDAIADIDRVRVERRGFSQEELDRLATLAATLPRLGGDAASEAPSVSGMSSPGITLAEAELIAAEPAGRPLPKPRRARVDTIVSVLIVDEPEWQARVRAALPPERFELLTAADPDEALRLARSAAPDVVLADRALCLGAGTNFIGRLREDPLTDFVPIVLLLPPGTPLDPIAVREAGADEALPKPFDAETLLRTVARVTDTLRGPTGASTLTGDMTVEEIADRLAEEVKRGLVEAAAKGRDVSVPMGDGTALLAAAWSAIGRVRAHVAERSGGRVRFKEGPQRGGPAFVTMHGEEAADDAELTVDLAGRQAIVVDDDPAVVWFFAGLLREHGADVREAADGIEALEKARARRPDLIISDILMPRLDGFGLTRALARDPLLADVPVILLSWKEDFLSRMRELKAGARGYLRKEAGSAQILAAVRDALLSRARLEQRLRAGGDVRGRLEDVGIHTLVTTVARERPDARLTIRDAASLYEADLRNRELVDITRTASDGTFARGTAVLCSLLGATTGRYTVADADGDAPVRRSIQEPLEEALRAQMTELAARVDAVSGKNLAKAARVELDEDVLFGILRASPEPVERVVGALRSGRGPRELLMSGEIEPQTLEDVLVDLSRQGAIAKVRGADDEDRIALARAARKKGLHPALTEHEEKGTLSWLPPPATQQALRDRVSPSLRDSIDEELLSLRPPAVPSMPRTYSELEPPALDEPFAEAIEEDEDELAPPSLPRAAPAPTLPEYDSEEITLDVSLDEIKRLSFERALRNTGEHTAAAVPDDDHDDEDDADEDEADEDDLLESGPTLVLDDDGDDLGDDDRDDDNGRDDDRDSDDDRDDGRDGDDDRDDDRDGDDDRDSDDDDRDSDDDRDGDRADGGRAAGGRAVRGERANESAATATGERPSLRVPPAVALRLEDDEDELPPPASLQLAPPRASESAPPSAPPIAASNAATVTAVAARDAERGMSWLAWVLIALALGSIGFVGWRLTHPAPETAAIEGPLPPEPSDVAGAPTDPGADPVADPSPDEEPEAIAVPAPWGREQEGLALEGVDVPDGQGLLVIEPGAAPMTVTVGEHEWTVGAAPLGLPMPPGVHHLTVVRGDHHDFIWVAVRAGATRFVPPLP